MRARQVPVPRSVFSWVGALVYDHSDVSISTGSFSDIVRKNCEIETLNAIWSASQISSPALENRCLGVQNRALETRGLCWKKLIGWVLASSAIQCVLRNSLSGTKQGFHVPEQRERLRLSEHVPPVPVPVIKWAGIQRRPPWYKPSLCRHNGLRLN